VQTGARGSSRVWREGDIGNLSVCPKSS
jgi:hypothetical protein